MHWELIRDLPASALANMQRDASLLQDLQHVPRPVLHCYDWQRPSLTYGYFVQPETLLCLDNPEWVMDAARRPTGGGVLFHTHDLAFSVLVPHTHPQLAQNTLANYAWINGIVLEALGAFVGDVRDSALLTVPCQPCCSQAKQFCMAHPTQYDVMLKGRKVGGAAQRRTRHGLLHQATICLGLVPEACLRAVLKVEEEVFAQMRVQSYPLLGANPSLAEISSARVELAAILWQYFTAA